MQRELTRRIFASSDFVTKPLSGVSLLANVVGFIYGMGKSLSQQGMSAFPPQVSTAKPANKLEFATDKETAAWVGVKSERSIRRYKSDPRARKILGAIPYGKQWRIPKQQDWAKIDRELKSLGKAPHVQPGRIFKRDGMG